MNLAGLFAFAVGLISGGVIVGLGLRIKIARLETEQRLTESANRNIQETFQSVADTALRSNQSSFLAVARTTLETTRAEITGDIVQKQMAIDGVVRPLS